MKNFYLFAMLVAGITANAQYTVIDDFESTDPFPWGSWVGTGTVSTADSHSGLQMFDTGGSWPYRTDVSYGSAGDTLSCWTKAGTGRTYWGFGASAAGCYSFVAAPNTSDIRFQQNDGYGYTELSTTPFTFTTGNWYRMEVIFVTDTDVVGNLYDSDGTTLLATVSETLPGVTPGGFAFRTFGGNYVDYLTAYDVCFYTYGTMTDEGCGTYTVPSGDETYMVDGTVTDTIMSSAGCDSILTITYSILPLPDVAGSVDDTIICEGNSVTFTSTGTAVTYAWDSGVTEGVAFTPPSAGLIEFVVTGTDADGCENTDTVIVDVMDNNVALTSSVVPVLSGADGEIDLTVTGAIPIIEFDWDNDGTGDYDDTEDLTGLDEGTYIVAVRDSAGCEATTTIVLGNQLGVDGESIELKAYPVPTSDNVTLEVTGEFLYEVFSADGKVIQAGVAYDKTTIDLTNQESGIFLTRVEVNGTVQTVRLVKL